MSDADHDAHLTETLELGDAIGMTGTPFFVVNGEPVEGANFPYLDELVAAALGPAEKDDGAD
ncbi:MAG: hypothetical protein MI723_00490, partial [Caulobacterales bacterium]|nr:hypothetical protein [Caulobacterales bacterium]